MLPPGRAERDRLTYSARESSFPRQAHSVGACHTTLRDGAAGSRDSSAMADSPISYDELPVGPQFAPAWIAGTDLRILALTPSEKRFYNSLGSAVGALSCLSGLMFSIAASFWLAQSIGSLWWIGVLWALFMACAIEPLIYQTASQYRRYLLFVLAPRALLTVMIAIQIAEPALLWINRDDINAYLTRSNAALVQKTDGKTQNYYSTQIRHDQSTIAGIRRSEQRLQNTINTNKFLASCEADTASCSTTHKLGCGSYCQHYRQLASTAQAQLNAVTPADKNEINQLQGQITTLTTESAQVSSKEGTAITKDTGLPARERALSALEREYPSTAAEAWFIRIFCFVLDLTPLTIKIVRMLSTRSPYEEMVKAFREQELVDAHGRLEQARVQRFAATAEADADIDIAYETARARSASHINATWERFRGRTIRRRRRADQPARGS
jgi:hypothetical protein